jgi:hypothetical protein
MIERPAANEINFVGRYVLHDVVLRCGGSRQADSAEDPVSGAASYVDGRMCVGGFHKSTP